MITLIFFKKKTEQLKNVPLSIYITGGKQLCLNGLVLFNQINWLHTPAAIIALSLCGTQKTYLFFFCDCIGKRKSYYMKNKL